MDNNFDITKIMDLIPHRYPMLLVDRVIETTEGKIHAIKNVTINEHFFQGHFPGHPVMPGVLILEALAQAAVVMMCLHQTVEWKDYIVYFATIADAHFRRPVVPGDVLQLHVELQKQRGNMWKMQGEALVDEQRVADVTFSAVLVKRQVME